VIKKRGDLSLAFNLPPTPTIVMPQETYSLSDPAFQPVKASSRKRKTPASGASTTKTKTKKAKAASDTSSNSGILDKELSGIASSLVDQGVAYFTDSEDQPEGIDVAIQLARYIEKLEAALAEAKSSGGPPGAKRKTRAELEADAEKIRRAAVSGIKKQMTWKPTCKTNTAKWSYDGLCADPEVFGILLGLDGPPTWKMKKIPKDTFEDLLGGISASVRYDTLNLTGTDVSVRYNHDSGEFKFSGMYGRGY